MKYQYKMVQIPPSISVRSKDYKGGEAAGYLEDIVPSGLSLDGSFTVSMPSASKSKRDALLRFLVNQRRNEPIM